MAQNRHIADCKAVVIGGSSGSIEVLMTLFPSLPARLPFPVIVVLHRKSSNDSSLAELLALKTTLPVKEVEDKDPLAAGHVYIAPADYHLLLEHDHTFSLDDSEKVHYSRPSLDVTFESAADVYGEALVGILLSGANADGANGLAAVKHKGGVSIAQAPETAKVGFMPQQAILRNAVDLVLNADEIAAFINALCKN